MTGYGGYRQASETRDLEFHNALIMPVESLNSFCAFGSTEELFESPVRVKVTQQF